MFQALAEFNLEELKSCLDKFVYLEAGAHETLEGFIMSELPFVDIKQGLDSIQPVLTLREAINNYLITNPLKLGYVQTPASMQSKEETQLRAQFWKCINKHLLKPCPIRTTDDWMTYKRSVSDLLQKGYYYFGADNPDSKALRHAWRSDQSYTQRMFTGFAYAFDFDSRKELWAYINKDTVKIHSDLLLSSAESLIEVFSEEQQERDVQTLIELHRTYKRCEVQRPTLLLERHRCERLIYLQKAYLKLIRLGFTRYISHTSLFVLVTGFLNTAITITPFEEFLELVPAETAQALKRLKKMYNIKRNTYKLWIMYTRAPTSEETKATTNQYILIMQILPPKSTLKENEYWSNTLSHNQYYLIVSTWTRAKIEQTNVIDRNLIFLNTYGVT